MNKGKVKFFSSEKGFGFIEKEDGKDIFVHFTGLLDKNKPIQTDDKVEFEIGQNNKGPCAIEVRVAAAG